MGTLETLQELGLDLPSPAYIAGVVIFSMIGIVAYYYDDYGCELERG